MSTIKKIETSATTRTIKFEGSASDFTIEIEKTTIRSRIGNMNIFNFPMYPSTGGYSESDYINIMKRIRSMCDDGEYRDYSCSHMMATACGQTHPDGMKNYW